MIAVCDRRKNEQSLSAFQQFYSPVSSSVFCRASWEPPLLAIARMHDSHQLHQVYKELVITMSNK
jgi:hypothetical protein